MGLNMKLIRTICFLFIIIFSTQTIASVSIEEKVLIDSQVIKLGNIFNGLPNDLANTMIGKSPEPGQKKIIRLELIKKLARNFDIDWNPNHTFESIVVRRASRSITANELKGDIIKALNKNGITRDYSLQISNNEFLSYVPINSDYQVDIINLNFNEKTERFFANIKIFGNDFSPIITNIKGFARSVIEIPVLINRINKGQIIYESDFRIIKVSENRINENYITDIYDIIGMEAKRNIREGSPIKKIDLRKIRLVEKGKAVSLLIKSDLMTIKTIGKALDHGSLGDLIRILNPRSRKIVSGIVIGRNEVRIPTNRNISFLSK